MWAELSTHGSATRIEGPLLFLRRTLNIGLNEAVTVTGGDRRTRLGRIAALDEQFVTVELLESSAGLALADSAVRFHCQPLHFGLGAGLLGREWRQVGHVAMAHGILGQADPLTISEV